MSIYRGRWHGAERYFGLHYDLHANENDTVLGARCGEDELVPTLRLMDPDFVQTDCKGHPGYTSWFSEVPTASVSPGVVKDAMAQWRAATAKLGLPLHCHYSGIWDKAAAHKHPEWRVQGPPVPPEATPTGQNAGAPVSEKMCPRGPYVDELLIPQMLELIDRYSVDGFWVDGDLWGVEPCYCERCRAAWQTETGLSDPPTETEDANWPRWWLFTLRSFETYVTRYCDAVHAHKPGVLVCSNWLQTFKHPGEPRVPTDWISGDNSWVWGLDGSRCEARFLSTRGKPWDIMLWTFYCSHGMGKPDSPWVAKPAEMLMQEAAVLLSFGGNVQFYETGGGLRDGRLIPWRMQRWGEVGRFVKHRRHWCQDTVTWPQIAILHSEHHLHASANGRNLMWNVDVSGVQGATFALLESHFGVDILDEWALLPRLGEFPLVVAPEQQQMSEAMLAALKQYVVDGGKLVVTGAESYDRFGSEFLGVESVDTQEAATWFVPAGDGAVPLHSRLWRLLRPTAAVAQGYLGRSPLATEELSEYPAWTVNQVGAGAVAYVPAAVCHDFAHNRYPDTRRFLAAVVDSLQPGFEVSVTAPTAIDVALRCKEQTRLVHLVNRGSGVPNQPNNGAIDELPVVGPVSLKVALAEEPWRVEEVLEGQPLRWDWCDGTLTVDLEGVRLHAAVAIM